MKKILLILSLTSALFAQATVFASLPDIEDLLPDKPSLNEVYPESMEELQDFLTPDELDFFNENLYYVRDGEEHIIRAFDGKISSKNCKVNLYYYGKFDWSDADFPLAEQLTSNGNLSGFIVNFKFVYNGREEDGKTLLCLYGNKAEQWFTRTEIQCSPPHRTYQGKAILYNDTPTYATKQKGYIEFTPITCAKKDYIDLNTDIDVSLLQIYSTYEDEDWMFVDTLEFNIEGSTLVVDIDDMECNLDFRSSFIQMSSGTTEERESFFYKFNTIYESEESYNKYRKTLGKGLSLVDSATDTEDEPEETEPEKEVESEEKEPEKITETEKEPTEPEKKPEPEVKEEEEKTEPEQKEEEQEQKPIPSNPDEVSVIVNGKALEFSQEPVIENNRVLVPMRKIFESLGATVEWEQAEKRVFATKGEKQIGMQIGSFVLNKGQDETVLLDAMPMLVNNHTLVPIRAVAESLDATVEWNASEKIVIIETK